MHKDIHNDLQSVFRKVFENTAIIITEQTTANDISGWDSLTHMTLINEIENYFKIEISFNEVSEFKTVGDMLRCIEGKL